MSMSIKTSFNSLRERFEIFNETLKNGILSVNEYRRAIDDGKLTKQEPSMPPYQINHSMSYRELDALRANDDSPLVPILRQIGMPVLMAVTADGRHDIRAENGSFSWHDTGQIRHFHWEGERPLSSSASSFNREPYVPAPDEWNPDNYSRFSGGEWRTERPEPPVVRSSRYQTNTTSQVYNVSTSNALWSGLYRPNPGYDLVDLNDAYTEPKPKKPKIQRSYDEPKRLITFTDEDE